MEQNGNQHSLNNINGLRLEQGLDLLLGQLYCLPFFGQNIVSLSVHQVVIGVKLAHNLLRDLPWPAYLYLHRVVTRLNLTPIPFLVPFWQSLAVHHNGGTELVGLTFN